ncbi:GNAT family N-acetyltransferase [Chryseobacterium sp. PMSZPI]|uniref:GNAT family N-acetyltransferase n=1 Tax=Chryseobacterium sp. PMSZPI TaxID=1033900 RepID=UPI000C31C901|nr:GNAT family N-acetyltransferase [Chryseobacterium sp. PMSZPI]PKF73761.1 N-acetyltransferase [Chryseobacterium sp. PMSZPI]
MIQLKTFNKKQLDDFVSSGGFRQYDFLPITKHRALSHSKNPKALDEQTLLILAFYNDQLAGYLGCLPDYFIIDEKKIEYTWLSTLYVSEEFRGKKVAKALLEKALADYKSHVVMAEFTKEAEVFFNKMGNVENVFPKNGKRYYFKIDSAAVISDKKSWGKTLSPIFKIVDGIANFLIDIKNILINKPDFRVEVLDAVDTEIINFTSTFQNKRNIDEINYFITHPWILEGRKKDNNYFFSSYAEVFKYFWIKIYDEQENLETCSLLLLRDGHLKTPYIFSKTDGNLNKLVQFLNDFIIKNKIKTFTSYHEGLNKEIRVSDALSKIYERDFKRDYLFRKELLQSLPKNFNPYYQDGDGDCMMT